jgi:hypothetical protein
MGIIQLKRMTHPEPLYPRILPPSGFCPGYSPSNTSQTTRKTTTKPNHHHHYLAIFYIFKIIKITI